MTYCLGIKLAAGLIMMADTRTNAGVDDIAVYRKLHILADGHDRLIVCATAGNLSVTQHVLGQLAEGLPALHPEERPRTMAQMPTMFRAAQLLSEAVQIAHAEFTPPLEKAGVRSGISMLLGGRIGDGCICLYLIYDASNFIEALADQPFLQIGETKYGKPILDRAMDHGTSLEEAVKVALLSYDSTIRSNLSVGLPIDLIVIPADRGRAPIRRRIEPGDGYFRDLSTRWSMLLNESRATIPDPPFMRGGAG